MAVAAITKHSLAQMLPYEANTKKNKDLQAGLKDYSLLLNVSLEAMDALEKGDLERFDAIVGENACEIRAVWVALIAKEGLGQVVALKDSLNNAKANLNKTLFPKKISDLMRSGKSLETVMNEEKLGVTITLAQTVLIQSFLLTQVRAPNTAKASLSPTIKNKAEPKNLKKYHPDATGKFLDALVSKVKKQLSALSVQFVRQCAAETTSEPLQKAVSEELNYLQYLTCIPMFPTYQAMIQKARSEGIPLIIQAKFVNPEMETEEDACLYFDGSKEQPYVQREPLSSDLMKSAWVVQGFVCPDQKGKRISQEEWLNKLAGCSIEDVILQGAAHHRQFPDEKVSFRTPELDRYAHDASQHGCSLDNPTFFFINHVFATTVGKVPAIVDKVATNALKGPASIPFDSLPTFGMSSMAFSKFSPRLLAPYVPSPT